ncbi:MAG: DUF806 family protein [Leuconostoc mesenteroides]
MNSLIEVRDLLRKSVKAYVGAIPPEQEQKVETVALVTSIAWAPYDYGGDNPLTLSEDLQVMIWFKAGTATDDFLWNLAEDLAKIKFFITWSDGALTDPETGMNKATIHIRRKRSKRPQYE